jgi:hypothetical protein
MSHRVTVQSEMTDKSIAIQALTNAKLSYTEQDNVLYVQNGGGRRDFSINLKTGAIVGDSDHHKASELGLLRQHYAHAKALKELTEQGHQVQNQFTDEQGNIVLLCRS